MRSSLFSLCLAPAALKLPRARIFLSSQTTPRSIVKKQRTEPPRISYVTDVEGDLEFWKKFVQRSHALTASTNGTTDLHNIQLKPNAHLVFGGDSVDKGGRDLAFLHSLLDLKTRYPNNVHLLLGNRDINKMRIAAELAPNNWLPAELHPGVYWRQRANQDGGPATPATFLASQPPHLREDTLASRLKYMLQDNMGSPRAFELRRSELALESMNNEPVSDERVLESYLDSIQSGGCMRRYLEQAQLAVLIEGHLFVHGAVRSVSMGIVPGISRREPDVHAWVSSLNAFAKAEVIAWADSVDSGRAQEWRGHADCYGGAGRSIDKSLPCERADNIVSAAERWGRGFFDRPGGRLMAYGMARQPDGQLSPTVVYASYLHNGHPVPLEEDVIEYLSKGGVKTVVVGHQPHGDAPVVMKCVSEADGSSVTVVTADSSFGGNTVWLPNMPEDEEPRSPSNDEPDFRPGGESVSAGAAALGLSLRRGKPPPPGPRPRGDNVFEVSLPIVSLRDQYPDSSDEIRVEGLLSNGDEVAYQVSGPVGTQRPDGWLVKGRLPDGRYLLSRGQGYKVENVADSAE